MISSGVFQLPLPEPGAVMSQRKSDVKIEHEAVPQPRGEHESLAESVMRFRSQGKCSFPIPPKQPTEGTATFFLRLYASEET